MRWTAFVLPWLFVRLTSAAVEPSRPAADFVNSIGVCTHWNYLDTPYYDYDKLRDLLVAAGIRHLRDNLNDAHLPDLARHGIATCVLAGPDAGTPEAFVARVKATNVAHPGAIDAIEGPNEPDFFWVGQKQSYKGDGFAQGDDGIHKGVVAFQRDLYKAAKADPATAKLTVIGPSLGKTYDPGRPFFFTKGELADSVDLGNFHPYAGGNPFSVPFPYAGLEKYVWHGTHPTASLDEFDYAFSTYGPTFKPKPMAATECGYSTNTKQTSIEAHARYVPRLFAEHFRLGIRRSYLYEFVDEGDRPDDREANFGLLKHDLTPKPAYTALKNLIALCDEPRAKPSAAARPPAGVDLALTVSPPPGYDRVQYVHHLLLAKRDGTHLLLLWHEIALEDASATPFRQVRHPDMPTTLKLPAAVKSVRVAVPNDGVGVQTLPTDGGAIRLNVPDRVMVVMF